MDSKSSKKNKKGFTVASLTTPGLYLLVFAACGWAVLIANLFGFAGASGWIFPVVTDIPGLAASTIFLALLGLTPLALKQLFAGKDRSST